MRKLLKAYWLKKHGKWLVGLIVTTTAIVISFTTPEVRMFFGLNGEEQVLKIDTVSEMIRKPIIKIPKTSEINEKRIVLSIVVNAGDIVEVRGRGVFANKKSSEIVRKFNVLAGEEYELLIANCPTRKIQINRNETFNRCS